ncbi:MAG: EAL and GGDEF domain-containing protein [Pseudodesulfovibrio sp.]|nr:EAL and GGDEF domain-containing protein [Pseudodesulfovibrio sp.]
MHMELPIHVSNDARLNLAIPNILILITIRDYSILKEMYGQDFINLLEKELKATLADTAHKNNDSQHIQFFAINRGESAFLVQQRSAPADIAYEYKLQAQLDLKRTMLRQTGMGIELGMGYAKVESGPNNMNNIHFHHALIEARRKTRTQLNMKELSIAGHFNSILSQGLVNAHYQPIMDFKTGSILGWESLARGPKESSFRHPIFLFETAEQLGRLFALEKLCREVAIKNIGTLQKGQKLFLNIHPKTMADPHFTPGKTLELMQEAGLSPKNIVFEITERHSVQEFDLFYRTLDHYRSQGFQIAVDDAGAGYAGLTMIAELQPEYIKLDKLLIDDVHKDPVKRALVETTVTFADKIGSQIIAEGIETKAQAICLKNIGVHYGQGYFIAKPATPKPDLTNECISLQSVGDIANQSITCSLPIGKIAQPPHAVVSKTLVSMAQDFFNENSKLSSIVVVENAMPKGLVMEYHLNRQLSSQYGIALYHKRSIDTVMDSSPLIVDIGIPVEQAARQAMKREPLKAYDDLIITRKGKLYGIVTVQNILSTLAKIQVEMAKGTNPLTGLPGNVALEQEVENRIAQNRKFSIIYGDLDHFKVYNDTYGFKNGDRVIKLAADILTWATKKHAPQDANLCHIGGDDFVLITNHESIDRICTSVTRCFGRLVKNCYCAEDQDRGWIKAKGRDGKERDFSLVSISLGVIEINGYCSLVEIGERAAHIKKFAKSIPGNSVAVDRRLPLGQK